MATKTILITGAGGSIGINLLGIFLRDTKWNIVCLDSFHHKGYRDRIVNILSEYPEWKSRVKEVEHNLTCPISPELRKEIGKVDCIIHLAALSDVFFSVENPVWTIKNNIDSTLVMLEYAREVKPEQFIYFSTDEVYGPVKKGQAHREWNTHKPSNAYAASKAASEDICYSYWRSYGVPLIITNTMNNFGFMQSASKFPVIIQKKVENGEKVTIHGSKKEIGTRFYIDSRDVADALKKIIKKGARLHKLGKIDEPYRYHIVGEKALSNLQLAKTIAKLMKRELRYELVDFHRDNPAHDIHYGLQNNNLKWHPEKLEKRLGEVIRWQQNNPEWIA